MAASRLTSAVWAHALEEQDPLATELIDRAVEALGAGIASAVNLLDVEAVVIGGGLGVRFGQPMTDRIFEASKPHLFRDDRPAGHPRRRASAISAERSERRCWLPSGPDPSEARGEPSAAAKLHSCLITARAAANSDRIPAD